METQSENTSKNAFNNANELGKTLSNGGITLSDQKTAFGKAGKRYPSFTP